MNLENDYQSLIDDIFNGEKDMAIFVLDGKHHYVFDSKENYCIDVRPEYQAYIDEGWMKAELYEQAINSFRNGIPLLSKDNFRSYIIKIMFLFILLTGCVNFLSQIEMIKPLLIFMNISRRFYLLLQSQYLLNGIIGECVCLSFTLISIKKYIDIQIGTGNMKNQCRQTGMHKQIVILGY